MEGEEEDRKPGLGESVTGKLLRDLHVMHRGDKINTPALVRGNAAH